MADKASEKGLFKRLPKVIIASFKAFSEDKGLKLSASLAYYTVFSIGPLLLLLLSLVSLFYGQAASEGKIFGQLTGILGPDTARQLQDMIHQNSLSGQTNFTLIVSIVTLVVGATSVFIEIQDSLNVIWKLKAKPKKGWLQFLKNRLISSSLIISLGFLMLISLVVNGAIEALIGLLGNYFAGISGVLLVVLNLVVTFVVVTLLFAILFKFLPDAKISWKHVRVGALFTSILFMIGRYVIGLYITHTGTANSYGAAGSIIILLLWVYYSAVILYLGAEFTQVSTDAMGGKIEPAEYAVHVQQKEVEQEVSTLKPQHPGLQ